MGCIRMGRAIIEQPDGLFCVWSTVVDDFLIYDATMEEIREWWREDYIQNFEHEWESILRHREMFQQRTYEDCIRTRNRIHGDPDGK